MENNEDLELLELQELALKCTTESVVRFNHLKKGVPFIQTGRFLCKFDVNASLSQEVSSSQ